MASIPARILLGIRRHPIRFLVESGVAFAAGWSLIEPLQAFLSLPVAGWSRLLVLAAVALSVGAARVAPPDSKSVSIPGTTARITIAYRDLFAERGVIAVPVNEFFDSALGAHVSPRSVHGQVITQLFDGDSKKFDAAADAALASVASETVQRESGRTRKYPVGTAAFLHLGKPSVLAFVLTETDLETLKVRADVPRMWTALAGMWQAARIHCNDAPLAVPLVGGGLAGVGLSSQQLLSTIVMSAAAESRQKRICAAIHICVLPQQRGDTDIESALALVG
jgi:hypothetical protein